MKQFIYFTLIIISHSSPYDLFKQNLIERKLINFGMELTRDILQIISLSVSRLCYQILNDSFNNVTVQELYLTKLSQDSGKLFNDLGSYSDCFYKRHKLSYDSTTEDIEANLTFVVYSIKSEHKEIFTQSKLLGACLPIGCLETEYVVLFRAFTQIIQINFINEDTLIQAYDVKEGKTRKSLQSNDISSNNYFPFYFLLIILSLSFIPKAMTKIFKWFYLPSKTKRNSFNSQNSRSSKFEPRESKLDEYKRKLLPTFIVYLRKLKLCFDISDNVSEIKNTKITMHDITITNDTGLSFTTGLRGIAMIFIVFGMIFEHLNDSPVKLFHLKKMLQFLQSLSFSFIIFCKRFGTNLGYSISGLCLTYKLLCYLDIEITKLDSIALSNESEENSINKLCTIEELAQLPQLNDLFIEEESGKYLQYKSKIKLKRLLFFHYRQMYKFILFIVFIFFFKYSYWIIISQMVSIPPMWIYMKEELINLFGFANILSSIFLYDLYIPNNKFAKNPFSAVINEISYFVTGSLLIFYFYKKNYRLDRFILYVCGLFSILKLILFFTLVFQRDRTKKYFPTKNFTDNYSSFIERNSLYNWTIYLTGVFFGLVNYAYQKSIEMSYSKAKKTNKKMLILPMKLISFFQGLSKIRIRLIALMSICSFIGAIFGFYLIYNFLFRIDLGNRSPRDFFENIYVNLYFLYDIDIAIWFVYLIIFPFCFAGDNLLIYFLKHDYWTYVSRPYFIFLLISNMVIYYIFYRSDSKIQINFVNVAFFGLLAILILFILNTLVYIFYDLPLKKLTKMVIYANEQMNDYGDVVRSKQEELKLSMFTNSNITE